MPDSASEPLVERYLQLGLALGQHIDGLVDAYYGPPDLAARAASEGPLDPAGLDDQARHLLADLTVDGELEPGRRTWLSAQVRGLHTTARKLADLPAAARRYVARLGELIGLPVSIVSVGPDRAQTIFC